VTSLKRSTKRRLRQGGLYAVLIALAVVLALAVDWESVRANFWAPSADENWHDLIWIGARNTVIYTAIAFSLGLCLALVLALMKLSDVLVYRWLATAYIELFRGLPALLTILLMAFGVPIAFDWRPPGGLAGAGVLGLVVVAAAYMAETLRAGIQAVPKGQVEASRSLGMSATRTYVHVVIPQAFRLIIPPLTNEFVLLVKDTSLLAIVGATIDSRELINVARDLTGSGVTAGTSTALTQAGLLYLVITLPLTRLVAWLEQRQRKATR
jgi:polar amino acid transport system permease protein